MASFFSPLQAWIVRVESASVALRMQISDCYCRPTSGVQFPALENVWFALLLIHRHPICRIAKKNLHTGGGGA
jgi:hypothetical protein